jgi:23S rRNA-/tRNA-specific pseudouridylate synthase
LVRFAHVVPAEPPHERIDAYAARVFEVLTSRNQAKKAIKAGKLTRNGDRCRSAWFVAAGEELVLTLSGAPRMPPLLMDLDVVHLDPWLAVVRKPAGIHVRGNHARTVHRALRHNLGIPDAIDALPDPDPVHRLDYRTSGLLLVARTAGIRPKLCKLFEERRITKRYRAVLLGRLEGEGEVCTPLDGRDAHTRWRSVGTSRSLHVDWLTEVELVPVTGRTHQLRRHMTELGHPVLGDDLHHSGKIYRGGGLFLSAVAQRFEHPATGAELSIGMDVPAKFQSMMVREQRRWERTQAGQT